MSLENQIKKLEDQQKVLDQKLLNLKQKRTQEVAQLIQKIDLKNLDTQRLIGLIVDTLEAPITPAQQERWRHLGKPFCRPTKTRLSSSTQKDPATKAA